MSSPESTPNPADNTGKPIDNFKGDSINGQDVVGGLKTVPIVVAPELGDVTMDLNRGIQVVNIADAADFNVNDASKPLNHNDGNIQLQ